MLFKGKESLMKKLVQVMIAFVLCVSFLTPVLAIDGVWHNPYGIDDLYEVQPTERYPRDPIAGETVYIKGTTWPVEYGQSVWVSYTRNGVLQQNVGAEWTYNDGNNSYWQASIGPFAKGDVITYTVYANQNGQNTKSAGPFSFSVTDWERVQTTTLTSSNNGVIVLNAEANTGTFSPKVGISFPTANTIHVQLSPRGNSNFESGISNYEINETASNITITTSALQVTISKSPYSITVYDLINNRQLTNNGGLGSELSWLTDGDNLVTKVRDSYSSPETEQFFGFGERYNNNSQRGTIVDTYVYNQYQNQGSRTYLAVPFFYSNRGYGIFLDTTCYSKFDMASTTAMQYSFCADTDGSANSMLDYYIIAGKPIDVINEYSNLTGKPQEIPKWAFGLWMSANEWDRQSEVLNAINNANSNGIPATAVVLEQWSDENTFYIFNDSTYTTKPGNEAFAYSDFTFGTKWPDPRSMADSIHSNGMKLILWQVPVLKYTEYNWEQKDNY